MCNLRQAWYKSEVILLILLSLITILFLESATLAEKVKSEEDCRFIDRNVILISIDTLGADHLGCYGYNKSTTPNIDEFRKDSVLFKETIAQAPSTLSSHASIFTSLIPSHHGASFLMKKGIPQEIVTMAEILKENNYRTISYNGGGQVAAKFGFDQGFDFYYSSGENFITTINRSINWIKDSPNERFFFFLHTYEIHSPYAPRKEYLDLFEKDYPGDLPAEISDDLLERINAREIRIDKKDEGHIINAYDAEIYSVDKAFGILIDFLKKEDLYNNTIVIFTSDHGEELGEHGNMGIHGHTLYDELLKIPLIIKFQNSKYASKIIDEQARSIDILPTLLAVLDIPVSEVFEGTSLIEWIEKQNDKELFAVSEKEVALEREGLFEPFTYAGQIRPASIRTKKWKLYDSRLFDLESDPLEKIDVSKEHESVVKYLKHNLDKILQQKRIISAEEELEIDKETLEQLKSLGYVD